MEYPFNIESVGITRPDPDYFISRDRSDYHIIEYIVSGKGVLSVGDKEYLLEAGDVYILPPESKHCYRADREQPFLKIWCNFYSTTFAKIQTDYRLDNKYVFHAAECEEEFIRIFEIANIGSRINDNEWAFIASHLTAILNKIAAKTFRPEGSSAVSLRAKEILDNSVFDNITVEDLAKQLFVSKTYLTREFKSMYGTSPYQYLLNKKLSQAKLLLRSFNMTIKQISDKLSFADEHYFSGLFKQKIGVSPSEFRRTLM